MGLKKANAFLASEVLKPPAAYSRLPRRKSISAILPVINKVKKHNKTVAKYRIKNKLEILLTFNLSIN